MTDLTVVVCVAFDHRAPVKGLRAFKKCVLACEYVETALEVSGSFDLIVQGKIASLSEFTEQMERIAPQISAFVSRMETNFVARKTERYVVDQMMWLPCRNGRRKVAVSTINKIEAEGDYMRVFVGDWDCLLHDTVRSLMARLPKDQFLQIHRSVIVRVDFIERLLHERNTWTARLCDGSRYRIAKSHVAATLGILSTESSKNKVFHRRFDQQTKHRATSSISSTEFRRHDVGASSRSYSAEQKGGNL
jgi:hypothetical protein